MHFQCLQTKRFFKFSSISTLIILSESKSASISILILSYITISDELSYVLVPAVTKSTTCSWKTLLLLLSQQDFPKALCKYFHSICFSHLKWGTQSLFEWNYNIAISNDHKNLDLHRKIMSTFIHLWSSSDCTSKRQLWCSSVATKQRHSQARFDKLEQPPFQPLAECREQASYPQWTG